MDGANGEPSGEPAPPLRRNANADIRSYLVDHPKATSKEVGGALGLAPGYVRRKVRELGLELSHRRRPFHRKAVAASEIPGPEMTVKKGAVVPSPKEKKGEEVPGQDKAQVQVTKDHAEAVAKYAAETYDWIFAAGRALWNLWDGMGYRASFTDAAEFADYLVVFFRENFEQVAALRQENRYLHSRLDEMEATSDPYRRQQAVQERVVSTIMATHLTGIPMTREEIEGLYRILTTSPAEPERLHA